MPLRMNSRYGLQLLTHLQPDKTGTERRSAITPSRMTACIDLKSKTNPTACWQSQETAEQAGLPLAYTSCTQPPTRQTNQSSELSTKETKYVLDYVHYDHTAGEGASRCTLSLTAILLCTTCLPHPNPCLSAPHHKAFTSLAPAAEPQHTLPCGARTPLSSQAGCDPKKKKKRAEPPSPKHLE